MITPRATFREKTRDLRNGTLPIALTLKTGELYYVS